MRTGRLALLATAGLLLGATLLFGGGSSDGRVSVIGGAALLIAAALVVAALWGAVPLPAPGWEGIAFVVLAMSFVAWNGVSILWSAATRPAHARVLRAGAVVVLYALLVALVLTYSRGGILAALVAIAVWLALTRGRFESVVAIVSAGVPAAAVLGVALSLPGIAQN